MSGDLNKAHRELVHSAAALCGLRELLVSDTSLDFDHFIAVARAVVERVGTSLEDASKLIMNEEIGYFPSSAARITAPKRGDDD